jgi:hypothetical protein
MAFDFNRFTRTTLAFNSGAVTLDTGSISNGPAHYTYSTSDSLATVAAANYFNPESVIYDLQVNDLIVCVCSDGNQYLRVATVDTTTTPKTITTAIFIDNSIQYTQVDVTLAELIGSNTASVLLVPAPATGQKFILQRANLSVNYGGTVLASGGAIHIQYADTSGGGGTKATGTLAAATLIAATADTSFGFSPVNTTLVDSATLNEGLYLAAATADFTGGTLSTYKVDVWYSAVVV